MCGREDRRWAKATVCYADNNLSDNNDSGCLLWVTVGMLLFFCCVTSVSVNMTK